MKKQLTTLSLALALVAAMGVNAKAEKVGELPPHRVNVDLKIKMNGELLSIPPEMGRPFVDSRNERTMVPVRFISEKLGYEVSYEPAGKSGVIFIKKGAKNLRLPLNEKTATLKEGKETKTLTSDATTYAYGQRTYVPLRFVGEMLGVKVNWDQGSKTVHLMTDGVPASKTQVVSELQEYSIMGGTYSIKGVDLTEKYGEATLARINAYRVSMGLVPVQEDAELKELVRERAKEQVYYRAKIGTTSHEGFDQRITRSLMGENLYAERGYPIAELPMNAFTGWKNSPGHNQNMLQSGARRGAVGVFQDAESKYVYAVYIFSD